MKLYSSVLVILLVLFGGCKKEVYTSALVTPIKNGQCNGYLLTINGNIYGNFSLPISDTASGTVIYITFTTTIGDSVRCFSNGKYISYPYANITGIYQ